MQTIQGKKAQPMHPQITRKQEDSKSLDAVKDTQNQAHPQQARLQTKTRADLRISQPAGALGPSQAPSGVHHQNVQCAAVISITAVFMTSHRDHPDLPPTKQVYYDASAATHFCHVTTLVTHTDVAGANKLRQLHQPHRSPA
jgi:hypothetical protein